MNIEVKEKSLKNEDEFIEKEESEETKENKEEELLKE